MNSPQYYSVYPTVCQIVFTTATFLFPKSIYGATVVIKLFLFACEVGTLFLMKKMLVVSPTVSPTDRVTSSHPISIATNIAPLIYALNPLIIIELIGNAHFEAAMIFFFVGAVFILKKGKLLSSAAVFSLSIVSKMLPMMFLPLLFKKLGWKRSLTFWTMVGTLTLLCLAPLYNALFFNNISKSLALYFINFEFNASIFYVWESINFKLYGYNTIHQISPFLTGFVVLFIFIKSFLVKNKTAKTAWEKTFFDDCLMVISVYFAFATTVHPWYAALPLAVSVFTTWRFPVVWTFFIWLTYSGYTEGSSKHIENMPLLIIEYSMVYAFFFFEWLFKNDE